MPFDLSVYLSIFVFTFLSREMGRALDGALSKYSFLFLINLMHSCISDYASCICSLATIFFLCVGVCGGVGRTCDIFIFTPISS